MFNKEKLIVFLITFFLFFVFPSKLSAQVIINEFVPNADTEWVELFNTSDSAEYLKAYYIDDDTDFINDVGSHIKQLSDLNISSIQYPFYDLKTFLNNDGDSVVLFDPDGNIVDQYTYSGKPGSNVSIGRSPDHTGGFTILSSPTKGNENSAPMTTATSSPTDTATETQTAISTQTNTPTLTPTKTPTPTKKATPTATPVAQETSDQENTILGLRNELTTEAPTEGVEGETSGNNKLPPVALILIVAGTLVLGVSGFAFIKKVREDKRSPNEQNPPVF